MDGLTDHCDAGGAGLIGTHPDRRDELIRSLSAIAYGLRCDVVEMVYNAGSGHLGGSFSAAEIVATLYWHVMKIDPTRPNWEDRDRLVLSKGHCAPVAYAALARRGYFDPAILRTFRKLGSILQGHPDFRMTPGVDMTSGSLGQGLSVALGMSLAARRAHRDHRVYVLLSDGEMQEGMVWEAAMAAHHHGAGNLTAIIDKNRLQVDGWVSEVMDIDPLTDKWRAFGWRVLVADGHNIRSLLAAFETMRSVADPREPCVIICETVKGKGVSWMEDVMEWHGGSLNDDLRNRALAELRPMAIDLPWA
ncbi:MAG: transketolase [Candidatus Limnocylindrales bacterium]|jgi:transketolase